MPDSQFSTLEAATALATEVKAALAASKLRFCDSPFVPTPFTTKAELVAAETNFDGYVAGGYALAAFTGPLDFTGGGSVITSPLVNVTYGPAGAPPVTGNLSAWWIEDASGDVRAVGAYDPTRVLAVVGQGFPFVAQLVYGRNAVAPPPS